MTENPSSPPARAARKPGSRRGHAAAATRLFVGAAAIAGTLDLIALMGAGADLSAADVTPAPSPALGVAPVATPPTTVTPTTPEIIVIVRRHVIVDGSSGGSTTQSTRTSTSPRSSASSSAPSPAPAPAAAPAPPPPPPPVTATQGS